MRTTAVAEAEAPPDAPEQRRGPLGLPFHPQATRIASYLGALATLSAIGVAFAPALLEYSPLGLVALSPNPRHMVMVAPLTDFTPFVLVGASRRLLFSVGMYYVGVAYGEMAIGWLKSRYRRLGKLIAMGEYLYKRAGYLMVVIAPSMFFAVLAGATRMPLRYFAPLAFIGQAIRSAINHTVGAALSEYILPILALIREHMVVLTLASVAAVLLGRWYSVRRRVRAGA